MSDDSCERGNSRPANDALGVAIVFWSSDLTIDSIELFPYHISTAVISIIFDPRVFSATWGCSYPGAFETRLFLNHHGRLPPEKYHA